MKIANIEHRSSSYLLNDLRKFNGIFRKDVTYDDIRSHKLHMYVCMLFLGLRTKREIEQFSDSPGNIILGLYKVLVQF